MMRLATPTTTPVSRLAPRLLVVAGVVALALLMMASVADGDEIRLNGRAKTAADTVTLADLADLTGSRAEALAGVTVATFEPHQNEIRLSIHALRKTLNEQDVHWGLLSLSGYQQCTITRIAGASESDDDAPAPRRVIRIRGDANQKQDDQQQDGSKQDAARRAVDFNAATVAGLIQRTLATGIEAPRADIVFEFNTRDRDWLNQRASASTGTDSGTGAASRWDVTPIGDRKLGRRLVDVRRYEGRTIVESRRLMVDVAVRMNAIVIRQSVTRGGIFTVDDLETREILLDDESQPIATIDRAIGQQATSLLRAGVVLCHDHLATPTLVERGRTMIVHVFIGGLVVRRELTAMTDGALDDVIPARGDDRKSTLMVRVTGRNQGVVESAALAAQPSSAAEASTTTPSFNGRS